MKTRYLMVIIACVAAICAIDVLCTPEDSGNHVRYEVTGTTDLPIITFWGDTQSEFMYRSDATTIVSYEKWIVENYTNGKELPLFRDDIACSAFVFENSKNSFIGRNLDFVDTGCPMIIKCNPDHGYKSMGIGTKISIFTLDETVEEMNNDPCAAAAPFLMMDGMNEKGLFCAHLVVHNAKSTASMYNAMFSMPFMRYILDNAANVEEVEKIAVEKGFESCMTLLRTFCMHLYVADAEGNTLVIECVNGKLCLTEGCDVVTNHYITPEGSDVPITESSMQRYLLLKGEVAMMGEETTSRDCMMVLKEASQLYAGGGTVWSVVYESNSLSMDVCSLTNYDKTYHFSLKG